MNESALKVETKKPRVHRSPHGPGLFVTDRELAEILGLPWDDARLIFAALDANTKINFPKPDRVWGHRRYMPKVREWLDVRAGLIPRAGKDA